MLKAILLGIKKALEPKPKHECIFEPMYGLWNGLGMGVLYLCDCGKSNKFERDEEMYEDSANDQ